MLRALLLTLFAGVLAAQNQPAGAAGGRGGRGAEPAKPSEDGIPVTNQLVIEKCSTCHTKDDKSNLSRISWERATPEGWEQAIKRMMRLNGLTLSPPEARTI